MRRSRCRRPKIRARRNSVRYIRDPVWDFLYAPIGGLIDRAAGVLDHIQFLTIRVYLAMVFVALVVLLMVLALWG